MSGVQITVTSKLVARRMLFGVLAYTLMRVKGLVTLPIMTRFLGPEGMGVVSMAGITASMLWPLLTMGLTYGLPVRIVNASSDEELRKVYGSAVNLVGLVTFLVIGLVVGFRTLGIGRELIDRYAVYFLATAVYVVASLVKELALLVPKVLQRTGTTVGFEMAMEYGGALIAISLLLSGMGPESVIWSLSGVMLLFGTILFFRTTAEFGYDWHIDWKLVQSLLIIGLPVIPVSLAQWALQGLDNYFIMAYYGQGAVGVYAVTYGVANLTLGLLAVLNYVYFPTLATMLKQGINQFESFLHLSLRLTTLLLSLWLLITVVLGKDAIALLAGPRYEEAALLIAPVVLGFIALTQANLIQQVPVAVTQRTWHMAYAYGLSMLANLGLNALFIPSHGLMGAAVATAVSYLLLVVLMLFAASRHVNGGSLVKHTLMGWVPAGAVFPVAWWSSTLEGTTPRAIAAIGCVLLFMVVTWISGAISRDDLNFVRTWENRI